ncbi:MAG: Gfo/Idh/MocA family oxidoreductase [Anaerolineales bacterium]
MSSRTLRWGLLSTARINRKLIEPLRMSKRNRLAAVASRSQEKAEAYARQHRIPKTYGSYEALLADPQVDVIYNPLPNHLHAEWTIRALEAGKHVLCEKPLALSLEEVDAIAAAARQHGRVVAEAFMYRTHPQTLEVQRLVQTGELGEIRLVRGSFTFMLDNPGDYRLDPAMGGGALWDVGCYPLSYTRAVLGAEPLEVFGWQRLGETGVDRAFVAQMRFPGEVFAQFDCSFDLPYHVFMEIVGSDATLIIRTPFCPGLNEKLYLVDERKKKKTQVILVKGLPPYLSEVEDMADAVLEGKPPLVSLADSRANTAAILALFESARTGRAVKI